MTLLLLPKWKVNVNTSVEHDVSSCCLAVFKKCKIQNSGEVETTDMHDRVRDGVYNIQHVNEMSCQIM